MEGRRVLHLIDTGGPGGAETIFLELVRGLPALGWTSVPVVPEQDWLACRLREVGHPADEVVCSGRFDLRYVRALRGLIRSERIDLVQAHLLGSGVYATLACVGSRIPVICTLHGQPDIQVSDRLRHVKTRILRRDQNRVVCVSEKLREHFLSMGVLGTRTVAIRNGIDTAEFLGGRVDTLREELGLNEKVLLLGAVGNVRESKAYDVLLAAFAHIVSVLPQTHLAICGDFDPSAPLYRRLLAQRERLGLSDNVHFLGFRRDVSVVLRSLDIFVLSSADEGFSLATVQAMAAAVPVVATRCGGPELILGDSGAGILVESGDPAALANAVVDLANAPGLASDMGRLGLSRANSEFSIDRMLEEYSSTYAQMLF